MALEECAAIEGEASVAGACWGAERGRVTELLDVVVIAEDEQGAAAGAPFALAMADGLVRMGATGPDGWIHERPAPAGGFTVLDAGTITLEP